MSPDPAPAPTPTPAPAPVPTETWIERQEHTVATGVHSILVALDPLRQQVEHDVSVVAHKTWQNAASFTAAYFERNRGELAKKAAERILAVVIAKVPGADAFAPEISDAVVTEAADMFSVLIAELRKEGQIIAPAPAPGPPAPTPAPAPEPPKP